MSAERSSPGAVLPPPDGFEVGYVARITAPYCYVSGEVREDIRIVWRTAGRAREHAESLLPRMWVKYTGHYTVDLDRAVIQVSDFWVPTDFFTQEGA